jgi:hypothetical protein
MKRVALLALSSAFLAACGANSPSEPVMAASGVEAPAFAKARQPATCATADAMVGSLITLVQRATHVQAPATEAALLAPLRDAHTALVSNPCDKEGALAAMQAFHVAVDASASTVTAAQVMVFHSVANSIIAAINLVP